MNAITLSLAMWLSSAAGSAWPVLCYREAPPRQAPVSRAELDLPPVPRLSTFRRLERPERQDSLPNLLSPPTAVEPQHVPPRLRPNCPAAPPTPIRLKSGN